ncbi:MAG: hypothetical protein Q9225_003078 [Loekoesia sp. 1 TL-2023]
MSITCLAKTPAHDCIVSWLEPCQPCWLRRGFVAVEKVVDAMEKYFKATAHLSGSAPVQARYEIPSQELDIHQIARFECVNGIALLSTLPAASWTVYHVFSNQAMLATIHEQANALCVNKEERSIVSKSADLAV